MRTKDSYLMLVHQIYRLLSMEQRLRQTLSKMQAECEGLRLSGRDVTKCENELQRIHATLIIISQTHADLVGLLRERMLLRRELRARPISNAGYFHQVLANARLARTKSEIIKIIDPEVLV